MAYGDDYFIDLISKICTAAEIEWTDGEPPEGEILQWIKDHKKPAKPKRGASKGKIIFLLDMFGNSQGETARITNEDDGWVYYDDGFHRPCYLPKSDEGKTWARYQGRKHAEAMLTPKAPA